MRKLTIILLATVLCLSFTACGKETTTHGGVDIGVLSHDSVDVMGVTYDLYDNGYALIETILHENAQLGETVTYNGTEYIVFGFIQPKVSNLQSTGAFGHGETSSPANLILPDSILNISNYALAYCNANTIQLPSNSQTIGAGVFRKCRNIENIVFPESVTYIGASKLFQNCTSLKSVTFPVGCEVQFFNSTFEGCTSLESVTIPASADYIGGLCFYQCYSLTSVTIEDGVERIDEGAFMDCPMLSEIVIPDTVTTVADYAFQGCTGLTDVTLSDNMTDVSANLFSNLDKQTVDVSGMTIRVKADLVSYVQSIYPSANVVAK